MEEVQRFHEYLLRQRTQIRNDRRTLRALKDCWKLLLRADPNSMSRKEYNRMYSTLLCEMTIYWDEEMIDAIQVKMWRRDVSLFSNLDFNRFCCSIFFFVEMWVQEVTQDSYDNIFSIVRSILAGHFPLMPAVVDAPDSPFKPTLESFDDAFDRERDLENMNLWLQFQPPTSIYYNFKSGPPVPPLYLVKRISDDVTPTREQHFLEYRSQVAQNRSNFVRCHLNNHI